MNLLMRQFSRCLSLRECQLITPECMAIIAQSCTGLTKFTLETYRFMEGTRERFLGHLLPDKLPLLRVLHLGNTRLDEDDAMNFVRSWKHISQLEKFTCNADSLQEEVMARCPRLRSLRGFPLSSSVM